MKTKYWVLLPLITILIIACSDDESMNNNSNISTGIGNIVTNDVNLNPFNSIEIRGICEVEVIKGNTFKASVSDYQNLIKYLNLEVIDSKLVIKTVPENTNITNSKAKAIIYLPSDKLDALQISGTGNIILKDQFNNINRLNISGEGDIICNTASTTNNVSATISGTGNINFRKMQSQNLTATIAGTGDITFAVETKLVANIDGVGTVYYQGNPTINKNITGVGSLKKL